MNRKASFFLVLALCCTAVFCRVSLASDTYSLTPPDSFESYQKNYQEVKSDPAKTAALFVMAMLSYTENETLGTQAITLLASPEQLSPGLVYNGLQPGPSLKGHLKRLKEKPYLARSYFQGTSPENGYQLSELPYNVIVHPDPRGPSSPGRVKFFIPCSGADSPRPITLKEDGGAWKVSEASSLFVGIRPPKP